LTLFGKLEIRMIKISEKAIWRLKLLLSKNNDESYGLRIGIRGSGKCVLKYFLAVEKKILSEDEIFEVDGLKIIIDKQSFNKLPEMELDYFEGIDRSNFIFRATSLENPPQCHKDH
jgi:iron-sulfur cluster assembly protein